MPVATAAGELALPQQVAAAHRVGSGTQDLGLYVDIGNGATQLWHCQGFLASATQDWHCQRFLADAAQMPLSIGTANDFWRMRPRCH